MRYHITPVRMAIIKNTRNNNVGSLHFWLNVPIGTVTMENSMGILQKITNRITIWFSILLLEIYLKKTKTQLKKIFASPCSLNIIYNSQHREITHVLFINNRMDLEGIVLSEISQTEKDKYCLISWVCRIIKRYKIKARAEVGGCGEWEKQVKGIKRYKFWVIKYVMGV